MTTTARCGAGFAALTSLGVLTLTHAAIAQGGDDAASAVPIAIPGTSTGTTVGYTDDSVETCPYAGSTSPDVYYAYVATEPTFIDLDLCESGYDTQVYVYDQNLELVMDAGFLPACNDDACSSSGGGTFRSRLACVPVEPGRLYYLVVDGWSGAAGPYTLLTTTSDSCQCIPSAPCVIDIPPDAIDEGEPCDFGNTAPDDLFNGGCDCSDPAGCFQPVTCGDTIAGRSYWDGEHGDTDWFTIDLSAYPAGVRLHLTGTSEFDFVVGRIDNAGDPLDCREPFALTDVRTGQGCEVIDLETDILVGSLAVLFVSADFAGHVVDCYQAPGPGPPPCFPVGADYRITFDCLPEAAPCPWDTDGNGAVDFGDLLGLLSNWGPGPGSPWDFDGDDVVGFTDLLAILSNWGPCPS